MQSEKCRMQTGRADSFPSARLRLASGRRLRSRTGLAVFQRNEAARHSQHERVARRLRSRERLHQTQKGESAASEAFGVSW